MIPATATLTITRIPLAKLHITENQYRYPDRLTHYIDLCTRYPDQDPGLIFVQPHGDGYELLDGHHRYCALIMTGRTDALCIIQTQGRPRHG